MAVPPSGCTDILAFSTVPICHADFMQQGVEHYIQSAIVHPYKCTPLWHGTVQQALSSASQLVFHSFTQPPMPPWLQRLSSPDSSLSVLLLPGDSKSITNMKQHEHKLFPILQVICYVPVLALAHLFSHSKRPTSTLSLSLSLPASLWLRRAAPFKPLLLYASEFGLTEPSVTH